MEAMRNQVVNLLNVAHKIMLELNIKKVAVGESTDGSSDMILLAKQAVATDGVDQYILQKVYDLYKEQ